MIMAIFVWLMVTAMPWCSVVASLVKRESVSRGKYGVSSRTRKARPPPPSALGLSLRTIEYPWKVTGLERGVSLVSCMQATRMLWVARN